jgi:hypothetical protein
MSRPKLEANTNRERAPQPKGKDPLAVDNKRPTRVKGKDGTFVGVFNGNHIHIVGDKTHVIVGEVRKEIKLNSGAALKTKTLKEARTALTSKSNARVPGYTSSLAWIDAQ